jgi:Na+-transporting methylmalonyl-CoA/oxaloacetate decarboxylase gamma subunit
MKILSILFHPGDLIGNFSLVWLMFFGIVFIFIISLFIAFLTYTIILITKQFDKEKKAKSLKNTPL